MTSPLAPSPLNSAHAVATPVPIALVEATPDDVHVVDGLVAAFHALEGVSVASAPRLASIETLLANPGYGRILLIKTGGGEIVGYAVMAFGFSLEFGGRDAYVDEIFILEPQRGKGLGSAALEAVCQRARTYGLCALHLEVERDNTNAKALYLKNGFEDRVHYHLMSLQIADIGKT
jgi:GNAT superfamily N-acetyltransferase